MKRFFLILMALMLPAAALAQPLTLAEDLTGSIPWYRHEGDSEPAYVYTYAYPQVQGEGDDVESINEYYRYTVEDTEAFTVPINGEQLPEDALPSTTEVSYTVTLNDDQYFSVWVTRASVMNGERQSACSAQIFSRSGEKPGGVVTLPYILGILQATEDDAWLQDRQTAKAEACVRAMVWEALEERMDGGEVFLDDVDEEALGFLLYPEEDFYLDEAGNAVFFFQPGDVKPEAEGPVLVPIPLEDIMDEL